MRFLYAIGGLALWSFAFLPWERALKGVRALWRTWQGKPPEQGGDKSFRGTL